MFLIQFWSDISRKKPESVFVRSQIICLLFILRKRGKFPGILYIIVHQPRSQDFFRRRNKLARVVFEYRSMRTTAVRSVCDILGWDVDSP